MFPPRQVEKFKSQKKVVQLFFTRRYSRNFDRCRRNTTYASDENTLRDYRGAGRLVCTLTQVLGPSTEIGVGVSGVFEVCARQRPVVVSHKTVHFGGIKKKKKKTIWCETKTKKNTGRILPDPNNRRIDQAFWTCCHGGRDSLNSLWIEGVEGWAEGRLLFPDHGSRASDRRTFKNDNGFWL